MSSDSSDDENQELLGEAVDNELFKNNLFDPNRRDSVDSNKCVQIQKPSLRHKDEEENNVMGVTPEMQAFVATKLMQFLDSNIKEVEIPLRCQKDKGVQGGIRLLGASPIFVSHEENLDSSESHLKRRKNRCTREDRSKISEEEQCREAAVSAEWILSQQAVLGWEPCTKGKVETYSQDDVDFRICGKSNGNLRNEAPEGRKKKNKKGCQERKRLKRQKEVLTSVHEKSQLERIAIKE